LKDLEYSIHFKVLDSKYFVPQHRERIIIVGFNKRVFKGKEKFRFPRLPESTRVVKDILETTVEPKYTLSDKLWNYLQDYAKKHKAKGNGFGFGLTDLNGISRTISARYYKDGAEILIPQKGKNPRRLTPKECARLQGFPDKFVIPVSDNQAYRQFGNSVTVPLIQAVGKQLVKELLRLNGKYSSQSYSIGATV
jgi:DNA (cytosine-5)-methyltransferase 1